MRTLFYSAAFIILYTGAVFAGTVVTQPEPVPALAPWGMIGSAVALGVSGLYFIIRRHK
ncbi:MAG: hypothetical protein ACM3MB_04800 [Acidobacteriota bacterium]